MLAWKKKIWISGTKIKQKARTFIGPSFFYGKKYVRIITTYKKEKQEAYLMKADELLSGFTILIVLQFMAAIILAAIGNSFPAPLLAMLIFAVLLACKVIKIAQIEEICKLLLAKMSLFFVSGAVSIVLYLDIIVRLFLFL